MHFQRTGAEPRVERLLEVEQRLVGRATLRAMVDEVVSAVEGDSRADHAARHHRTEVADERVAEMRSRRGRQHVVG